MKLNKPAVWAPLLSLALVLWFVWQDSARVSPGPLSAAHAQDPDISERNCEICHGEDTNDRAEMAQACWKCHEDIDKDISGKRGLHGRMPGDVQRCGSCHSEHHGPQFQMVSQASFLRAGVEDVANFDHAGLSYELTGKHLTLECQKCHENSDVPVLEKGKSRFLGKSQKCETCHKDPHDGRLPDCKNCHGEERPFLEAPLYKHTEQFPLTGAHSGVTCVKCHEKIGPSSIEADGEANRKGDLKVRACAVCHESPHGDAFLNAALAQLKLVRDASCERCHPLTAKTFKREGASFEKEWHAFSGFALVPPHEKQECRECHKEGLEYKQAHPGRTLENCAVCHEDIHKGQFGERKCRDCHAYEAWKPSLYDVAMHAKSAFPLEQTHATTKCNDCHLEQDGLRRYVETKKECVACHADAHPDQFPKASGCQECHQADNFASAQKSFDHGKWTGFVVDKAHEKAGCESCHLPLAAAEPETKRRFGRIAVHAPATASQCVNCHTDAHRGFFKQSKDCDECHGTQSFSEAKEKFEHAERTGFTLVGSHQTKDCTVCHVPTPEKNANGRSFGFSKVDAATAQGACTSCHTDVHKDSFKEPSKNCLDCHTQVEWTDGRESFEHLRWTGFDVEGRHKDAGCQACHTPLAQGDPSGRRFARALGRECSSCHKDPHVGQFATQGKTTCTRCHVVATDFHNTLFDHQRDSRFPLDETHKKVACAGCHFSWPLQGGGSAVRYKPLGILCGDCHDTRR
ncbi:MAG: hypothetical protein IPJ19_17195 [Planctomycetes bacterium]|nr:hypothetical protein [Planctomycetota bacterium]